MTIIIILDEYPTRDPQFRVSSVDPLMGVNDLWRSENQGISDIGALIEIQTVASHENVSRLARCWWPLTSSLISRTLNVSFEIY